jgi:hypothetical protein
LLTAIKGAVSGLLIALASGWLGGEVHLGESMHSPASSALLETECLGWMASSAGVETLALSQVGMMTRRSSHVKMEKR